MRHFPSSAQRPRHRRLPLPRVPARRKRRHRERRARGTGPAASGPDPRPVCGTPPSNASADALVGSGPQPSPDPPRTRPHRRGRARRIERGGWHRRGQRVASTTSRSPPNRSAGCCVTARSSYNIDGPDGTCIGIGRAGRTPPRWLRRRLHRDGTCRFPGCGRRIRHLHHIHHWTNSGPTDTRNLCGLCWDHHHLVHEGGWTIEGNADGELTFTSPAGRWASERPPPLDREVRRRMAEVLDLRRLRHDSPGDEPPRSPPRPDP